MNIVFFGLSLSSSWGNGHATTYRGLLRALAVRGHRIVFYEQDVPWYAENRDLESPDYCRLKLYKDISEVDIADLRRADAVVIGSFVGAAHELLPLVRKHSSALVAFYDIDTPVTVSRLEQGDDEYLSRAMVPAFDVYLSFTGGPIMDRLHRSFGAKDVRLFGCSADPILYRPMAQPRTYALGYLGTYDPSRQPMLERLLIEPARAFPDWRFIVAGPQYPDDIDWPANVERVEHLPPSRHAAFYNDLEYALNVTRADMVAAGYSPSVRIFEAAACACPVITDAWPGLATFFEPEKEILVARTAADILGHLSRPPHEREALAAAGQERVLREHTGEARARQFETLVAERRAAAAPERQREEA